MVILNKLTVKQRLWGNLLIVTAVLAFIAITARSALLEMADRNDQLKSLQENQTINISRFQTQFSNTLLSMNQYALTLEKNHGEVFNTQIENLKKMNLSLNSEKTQHVESVIAETDNKNEGSNKTDTKAHSEDKIETEIKLDSDTAQMAEILTNIKKSANSLVFLKTQVQETILYGIEPSEKTIIQIVETLKGQDDTEEETIELLHNIEERLKSSKSSLAKMISSQALESKTSFDEHGLGDSADSLFESLTEAYEGDFSNMETVEELISARDGFQESFNDLADYFKTTKQNNITISQLSYTATELVQKRMHVTEQKTLGLIDEIDDLGSAIIREVTIEVLGALALLAVINLMIVKSITSPLSSIRERIIHVVQNGNFSEWKTMSGKNELTDIDDSIRTLLQSVKSVTSEINQVSRSLVEGNLKAKVEGFYNGDLKTLSDNFNDSMVQVRDILKEIDQTSIQIANGQLDMEIQLDHFKGDYHKVMSNLKSAIDIQRDAIENIINIMQHVNEGDFSHRIETQLPGEYNRLKDYLNASLINLETAIDASNIILNQYQLGDFSFQSPVKFSGRLNDLKSNMDALATNVSLMLNKVKIASHDSLNGVAEISTGNQDLSQRVQVQAAALQSTNQNMDHIAHSISISLKQANEANTLSTQVKGEIEQGSGVVQKMNQAMHDISEASKEIADITNTIDSIAFQTNLLALNAAVEAARAGEAGRGFAVVAGEVRTLAGNSAEAAKRIREVSENSITKVQNGIELSQQTTQTFAQNETSVKEVSIKVSEVHRNLQQQVQGIQEINRTFNEIDHTTQQNASLVEEIAASSMNITSHMQELEQSVDSFKLLSNTALQTDTH